jgi:hypothetical protein
VKLPAAEPAKKKGGFFGFAQRRASKEEEEAAMVVTTPSATSFEPAPEEEAVLVPDMEGWDFGSSTINENLSTN